jgi:hypothetical protein
LFYREYFCPKAKFFFPGGKDVSGKIFSVRIEYPTVFHSD